MSRFVKDVRTLAAAGELQQTLASMQELSQHLNATDQKFAA
jgi:hypothetical protein